MTVEDALRRAEDMAAFIRYSASVAAGGDERPDPQALNGLHDIADEIAQLLAAVRRSLSVNARDGNVRERHAA